MIISPGPCVGETLEEYGAKWLGGGSGAIAESLGRAPES